MEKVDDKQWVRLADANGNFVADCMYQSDGTMVIWDAVTEFGIPSEVRLDLLQKFVS